MPTKQDKRTRLTQAAKKLVHEHGLERTTLADIASEAKVPLGNVYYYFKTKDDIGAALIAEHASDLQQLFDQWNAKRDPKARLIAFIDFTAANGPLLARHGCPIGSLCQELGKTDGPLLDRSADLFRLLLEWTSKQFDSLGKAAQADALALHLLSALQGASLVTNAFRDPALMKRQTDYLKRWIRQL